MQPSSNPEDTPMFGSNPSHDKDHKEEKERDRGKLPASTSSKSSKEAQTKMALHCKFCNKKFSNSQALGGHQNAHKEERAAAKRENILTMASAYRDSQPSNNMHNYYSNFGGRTLGVQPLPMIHKPTHVALGPGYLHNVSLGKQIMNPQPTMHQLQALMADRSGFHHNNKIDWSTYRGRPPPSSWLLPQSQPSLCENINPSQANSSLRRPGTEEEPDSTLKQSQKSSLCDDNENSDQANASLTRPRNETKEELDLTLKL